VQDAGLLRQKRGRHEGECGVLGPTNVDRAAKGDTPLNQNSIHSGFLFLRIGNGNVSIITQKGPKVP
jgi:hypothetical protein